MIFHILICILHLLRVYYELTMSPAARWLDSSVGRALHWYRRGHCLIQSLRHRFRPVSVTHFHLFRDSGVYFLLEDTELKRLYQDLSRLYGKAPCWLLNNEKPSDGFWKVWILRMQTLYSKIHFNVANPLQEQGPPLLLRMLSNRWQYMTLTINMKLQVR